MPHCTLLMGMKMKSGSNLLIHLSTLPKRLISGSSLLVRGLGLQCGCGESGKVNKLDKMNKIKKKKMNKKIKKNKK